MTKKTGLSVIAFRSRLITGMLLVGSTMSAVVVHADTK